MPLFPYGKRGGTGVAYGYKGKGFLIHLLVDADEMPLSERSYKNMRGLAADKGCDADMLRNFLEKKAFSHRL